MDTPWCFAPGQPEGIRCTTCWIEALARFWDTHDITDFEDELEEVREPVFDRGGEGVVRIRLHPEQAEALKRIARARGIDEAELVEEYG